MEDESNLQHMAGQVMAMGTAITALIATHPDREALSARFADFDQGMQEVLLTREAIQGDAGMRAGYSEVRRLLLTAMSGA